MQNNSHLIRKYNKGIDFNNFVSVDVEKKYAIVCNGVKKTSNAKKVTSYKLEAQINAYSNAIGNLSINAKLKKDVYESSRKLARKKLKAKV